MSDVESRMSKGKRRKAKGERRKGKIKDKLKGKIYLADLYCQYRDIIKESRVGPVNVKIIY